jgi:conjugal transfer pilus assembly protein TraV
MWTRGEFRRFLKRVQKENEMIKAISIISFLLMVYAPLMLTSCSARFACKDKVNIEGEKCNPITTVYENKILGKEGVSLKEKEKVKVSSSQGTLKGAPKESATPEDVDTVRSLSLEGEKPIRLPPRIIRMWVAPWEDGDGDLHQPSYIYSEISPKRGRWLFGEKELVTTQPILRPVEKPGEDSRKGEGEKKEKQGPKEGDSKVTTEPFRLDVQPNFKLQK